jgi:uncharacterized protein with ATP-grasp and redox domains
MKAHVDCYPCFINQALKTSKIATSDQKKIHEILSEVGRYLLQISFDATPPEISREIYGIISRKTGVEDPYRRIKEECTQQAISLYPRLEKRIDSSDDPLLTALRVSIAGNVMDFGANAGFDLTEDIETILSQEFAIDHYSEFSRALRKAKKILFLADNAGETVFDRPLVERLKRPVVYAVREKPIINDAVYEDALQAGMGDVAEIISSGSDAAGTPLNLCSQEFLNVYCASDLILSKGQGNYECLSEEKRPLFFLLKAKCSVVARDIGVQEGSIVLMKAKRWTPIIDVNTPAA